MDSAAFLADVKTKPLYVGFFHGEFDVCPTENAPRHDWLKQLGVASSQKKSMVTIPEGISILHMTRPGAYLTLNSSILYYLIHQKAFYTNTLMPLFAVKSVNDLTRHPNTEYVYWDMEKRNEHSMENIVTVDAKLSANGTSDAAKSALDLMKSITQRKMYDMSDKTVFTSALRYDRGDDIPNLALSRFDATMTGLGLYKFTPDTKRVDRILLDKVLKQDNPYIPKSDFTVSDILSYINARGGGRLVLFSCSSLAPDALRTVIRRPEQKEKFDRIQSYIDEVQANYNQKNPVFSPETEEWLQFTEAFPKIQLPDLAFHNVGSLKAHNYKPLNWILFNLLAYGNFYKDMPVQNFAGSWRDTELQKDAPHGWYLQNTGQRLKNTPEEGEGTVSYMCRRTKQGCSVQGGKRNTRNTRKIMHKKRKTRKHSN